MAVTQERHDEILAEERLRLEIQKQLKSDSPKRPREKWFAFFNSNVGIFLLSSIFLSFFSWSYTNLKYQFNQSKVREIQFQQLKIEIAERYKSIEKVSSGYTNEERAFVRTAFFGLNKGKIDAKSALPAYTAMFPEYRDRNLKSLVWELRNLVVQNERSKLDSIRLVLDTFPRYFWKSQKQTTNEGKEIWKLYQSDSLAFNDKILTPIKEIGSLENFELD